MHNALKTKNAQQRYVNRFMAPPSKTRRQLPTRLPRGRGEKISRHT